MSIIKIRILGFNISSVFLLAIVINNKIVKTKIGFLMVLDINLNNNLFYCSYNIK